MSLIELRDSISDIHCLVSCIVMDMKMEFLCVCLSENCLEKKMIIDHNLLKFKEICLNGLIRRNNQNDHWLLSFERRREKRKSEFWVESEVVGKSEKIVSLRNENLYFFYISIRNNEKHSVVCWSTLCAASNPNQLFFIRKDNCSAVFKI